MKLTSEQSRIFLFVTQGVGIIFCGLFLLVYFGGLPSTGTLNSEPFFIFSQSVFGVILIILIFLGIIISSFVKKKK